MGIRRYEEDDADAVVGVWLEASRVGHPFLSDEDLARQSVLVREVYLPMAETWVAEAEGRVVGFVSLLDNHVGALFVAPSSHGTGLGRRLVEHAAALRGTLTVDVYADNPMAPGFYRRCGFVETARKPQDDEGRPLELIVMERVASGS